MSQWHILSTGDAHGLSAEPRPSWHVFVQCDQSSRFLDNKPTTRAWSFTLDMHWKDLSNSSHHRRQIYQSQWHFLHVNNKFEFRKTRFWVDFKSKWKMASTKYNNDIIRFFYRILFYKRSHTTIYTILANFAFSVNVHYLVDEIA